MAEEKAKRDFRQEATDLIVDMLEKGTAPWQRPWDKNTAAQQLQMPHNGATPSLRRRNYTAFRPDWAP